MTADGAVLTPKAGAFACIGHQRGRVDFTAVQVLGHIGQHSIQVVPDAVELLPVRQPHFGRLCRWLPGFGAEAEGHKGTGAPGIHGMVNARLIQQQSFQRVVLRLRRFCIICFRSNDIFRRGIRPQVFYPGCRALREQMPTVAFQYPEIAKMQTKAVIRAAINVQKAHPDWTVKPEIMIPLVGEIKELKYVKKFVVETADAEIAAAGSDLKYEVGTMIEIPRAALTADEIAKEADFFCFGTNDLTQMTFGFSRDDAGKFLDAYYDAKIFENDPFAKLDQTGVGKLMDMAIALGKPVNPNLHVGICGEHGGDPSSVEFCNKLGLDYVSCSPFRVPIARLAAAQAAIAEKNA